MGLCESGLFTGGSLELMKTLESLEHGWILLCFQSLKSRECLESLENGFF